MPSVTALATAPGTRISAPHIPAQRVATATRPTSAPRPAPAQQVTVAPCVTMAPWVPATRVGNGPRHMLQGARVFASLAALVVLTRGRTA